MVYLRIIILVLISWLLLACNGIELGTPPPPEPTPTATPKNVTIAENRNAGALMAAHSAARELTYGLAPLLLLDETRLVITQTVDGVEAIYLNYPTQPENPAEWLGTDSFVLSKVAEQALSQSDAVLTTNIIQFGVAAPLETQGSSVQHLALSVDFADGTGTIVDLSPLATDFGALHTSYRFLLPPEAQQTYSQRRSGVLLNTLQPMDVVEAYNEQYYLLAQIDILPQTYNFYLQAHNIQLATHTEALHLNRGSQIELSINRQDFEALQSLFKNEGETVFVDQPELWQQYGEDEFNLTAVLEENLRLMWHMVTKLELC